MQHKRKRSLFSLGGSQPCNDRWWVVIPLGYLGNEALEFAGPVLHVLDELNIEPDRVGKVVTESSPYTFDALMPELGPRHQFQDKMSFALLNDPPLIDGGDLLEYPGKLHRGEYPSTRHYEHIVLPAEWVLNKGERAAA